MAVFGGRVFKEVIKLKIRLLEWALIQYDGLLIRRDYGTDTHRGKNV